MLIKVTKFEKSFNIIKKNRLSPIKYNIDFLQIHLNIFNRDNKIEKLDFLNIKSALINIGLYSSFL